MFCATNDDVAVVVSGVCCTVCKDKAPKNWNKDCASADEKKLKCKARRKWIKKQYCQLSCFKAGKGYDGVVCCE